MHGHVAVLGEGVLVVNLQDFMCILPPHLSEGLAHGSAVTDKPDVPVGHQAELQALSGIVSLLQQLPSNPALQFISSNDSPVAVVYQLQQLCGCSVSALLPSEKPSEHSRVGELRFIMPAGSEDIALWNLSPKEGFHKAFMGYLFRVHAWLVGLE